MLVQRALLRISRVAQSFSGAKHTHEIKSAEDFKAKISSIKTPVLVDFYANWCGPCKALMPRLLKKAESDNGKWVLLKVDIDVPENAKICEDYRVSAVPTLVLIKDGKTVDTKMGVLSDEALSTLLK